MTANPRALVIVESPTKARTIRKFLGDEYVVEASMGHVRDLPTSAAEIPAAYKGLPWARLGVDVDQGFLPIYVVPADKKKVVTGLKKALTGCDRLYIATDEDREGEAIGWHLVELLKPRIPTFRMVFHEITRDAIQRALANPREIDTRLVRSQETRRVLDRLVGYEVSPLLWRKVAPKLSAGRVQSVAVRLLVLRERERMAFVSAGWWDIKAHAVRGRVPFDAALTHVAGQAVASGRDFDDHTGQLRPDRKVLQLGAEQAQALAARLAGVPLTVTEVERKESTRQPYPPFTTSTLQQEANRKLGLSASQTMQVAQKLYENGHITYMRTDSVNLSTEAVGAVREMIERRYGAELLSPKPRQYATTAKGAQEAHEAIRPAGTSMATARELGLSGAESRVYELIWTRTVASQMANARVATTTARLQAPDPADGSPVDFRASGRQVVFPGFFRAYVEGTDDPSGALDDKDSPLPMMDRGDVIEVQGYEALGHETRPPARYTEATLVKALETQGIGRPSTYASIIDTVQRRGYVRAAQRQLIPTFTAMAVTRLLEETLGEVVDVEFTASMEAFLDTVAEGGGDAEAFLETFYRGALKSALALGEQIETRRVCTIESESMAPYSVRLGKFGPFVEVPGAEGERPRSVSLPDDIAPADVDRDYLDALVQKAEKAEAPLGYDTETGMPVYLRTGRFGPYLQLGDATDEAPKPKRSSLPANLEPGAVDLNTAMALLSLPRRLGDHPEDGAPVEAGLGRFGPYIKHQRTFASLKKTDDLLSIGLARGLELLAEKATRGRRTEPLRVMGDHPEDGAPVEVHDGRYGPYVKHQRTNATLPNGVTPEILTMDQALELLAARATRKGSGAATAARARKPAAAKAAGTKKEPGSKAGPKKAASKKAVAAKAAPKKAAGSRKTAGGSKSAAATAEADGGAARPRRRAKAADAEAPASGAERATGDTSATPTDRPARKPGPAAPRRRAAAAAETESPPEV